MIKSCESCKHRDGGVCYNCKGVDGVTECGKGGCDNYEPVNAN